MRGGEKRREEKMSPTNPIPNCFKKLLYHWTYILRTPPYCTLEILDSDKIVKHATNFFSRL
jgi:hypothetical protein